MEESNKVLRLVKRMIRFRAYANAGTDRTIVVPKTSRLALGEMKITNGIRNNMIINSEIIKPAG